LACRGEDQQLQKGGEVILEELAANPEELKPPPYPKKN